MRQEGIMDFLKFGQFWFEDTRSSRNDGFKSMILCSGQICGDPVERSNEVRTEPQGADAGDQAILEGADRAGPGNHEMSDRPRQVPQIPPYWPIPLLPSSKINSELQNVVNVAGPVQERFARHQSYVGVAQSREIIAVSALGAHRKSCLKRHRVKEDSLRACLESSPQPNEATFILLPFCL